MAPTNNKTVHQTSFIYSIDKFMSYADSAWSCVGNDTPCLLCLKKNLNAPRPSEHPHSVIGNRALCAGYFSVAGQHCCSSLGLLCGFCGEVASPSCVCFIYFGFLLATICVWVWMVCSLHSVTTGSRDRANVSLIIESSLDRPGLLSPTHDQHSQQQIGQIRFNQF